MIYDAVCISLEIFCVCICCILFIYQLVAKRNEKTQKWFTHIIVSNTLMMLGDIADRTLGGNDAPWAFWMLLIFSIIIYYTASGAMLFSIFGWVYSHIVKYEKISPLWMKFAFLCSVLQAVLALLCHPLKIDYINSQNYYTRGDLFFLTTILPYMVYLMAVLIWLLHFRAFNKSERIYMFFFLTIPLIAQIIQMYQAHLLLFNPAVTIGLIILILFVQGQREHEKDKKISELAIGERETLEQIRKRQEGLNEQLIDTLCGAVEAKDIYTRGHSLRVAQYAREIMYRLGGDDKQQQEVYHIGILHDIGKISVRDEIINKKGKLTDDEYEQIKLHTVSGYQILRGVDMIPDLAVGARWHHEKYDGTGYPNGLSGENIPLIARIISVADAYDAMTSNRSYRAVMPQSQVRSQIEKGMGTQFDPKIAQIMLDMIDEDLQYEMRQINYNRLTNILLIDDDQIFHNIVNHALSNENYIINVANSGEEGIELLKENKYDLCLLDMEMPGMNGFEVLEWIQKNIRKMKVIFLTGDKEMETIKKSKQLGAVDYLTKPINVGILKETINSVLTH